MAEFKIEEIDETTYGKFLEENPPDDPFSLLPFLLACREAFHVEPIFLSIFKNGTPIGVSSFSVGKRFGVPLIQLIPGRTYDGVQFRKLGESTNQKQEYEKLLSLQALEEFLERNFAFHQIVFPPIMTDIRAFQWAGAKVEPQYTYKVNLSTFSEERYTKSLIKELRSAKESGLTAQKCGIDELAALQKSSYGRHGRTPPIPTETLKVLLEKLDTSGLLKTTGAKDRSGRLLSAIAALRAGKDSYLFVGGMEAGGAGGASHLLYHEILKSEKENGMASVDFCGANTPSINLFKSAFGPELQVYFRIMKANSAITRLALLLKKS